MSHELYDIRKNIFGRWFIVHPREPGLAWTGSRWAAHYKGLPIAHIEIAHFETPSELHKYALEHIEDLKATLPHVEESTG